MTLQEILKANGVADDVVEKITNDMKTNKVFTTGEENLDIRYGKLKTDFDNLTAQNTEANNLIEQLKAGTKDSEKLQGQITAYEGQVAELKEQLKQTQLDSEIKVALLSAKVTDIDYMTYKLKEKGELELGEDGHIKGIDDKIAGLKTQYPTQFAGDENGGREVLGSNGLPKGDNGPRTVTKEQFLQMGYNERLALKQENEQLYKQLAKN